MRPSHMALLGWLALLITLPAGAAAQIKATSEHGRKVYLYDDGT